VLMVSVCVCVLVDRDRVVFALNLTADEALAGAVVAYICKNEACASVGKPCVCRTHWGTHKTKCEYGVIASER